MSPSPPSLVVGAFMRTCCPNVTPSEDSIWTEGMYCMNKRKHFIPSSLSLLLSSTCRVRRLEPGDILLLCFALRGHGMVGERYGKRKTGGEGVSVKNTSTFQFFPLFYTVNTFIKQCVKHVKTQLKVCLIIIKISHNSNHNLDALLNCSMLHR